MRLDRFQNRGFERGRSRLTEALWLLLQGLLVESWIPGSSHRIAVLRLFGAKIGRGVVIKPHVRVSEVAYEVGFSSLTHFNRSFRRVVGYSPTQWRRRQFGARHAR